MATSGADEDEGDGVKAAKDVFTPGMRVSFVMAVKEAPHSPVQMFDWPADVISVHGQQVSVRYEWRGAEVLKAFHWRQLRIG